MILNTNLESIRMIDFLKCYFDKDISPLIIEGDPTEEELKETWFEVLSEYYSLIKTPEVTHYIRVLSRIESYNLHNNVVSSLVQALLQDHNPELIEQLNEWGYKYKFSEESLERDCQRVLNGCKNNNIQIRKLKDEFDRLQKHSGNEQSKEDFYKIVQNISIMDSLKYVIEDFSVYSFGVAYNRLLEHCKQLKNTENGRRR